MTVAPTGVLSTVASSVTVPPCAEAVAGSSIIPHHSSEPAPATRRLTSAPLVQIRGSWNAVISLTRGLGGRCYGARRHAGRRPAAAGRDRDPRHGVRGVERDLHLVRLLPVQGHDAHQLAGRKRTG